MWGLSTFHYLHLVFSDIKNAETQIYRPCLKKTVNNINDFPEACD